MEEKFYKIPPTFEVQPERDHTYRQEANQQVQEDGYGIDNMNVQDFKEYIQNFDTTLTKVNINQLEQLKKKYRFYLSKVEKLEQTRDNLQEKYDSIEDIVQNSSPVKEEKESINFITTITDDANCKLQQLMQKVEKAKEQKRIFHKQIQQLKQILKKEKSKFFEAKRAQTDIKSNIKAQQKASRLESANCTFKNIMNEKKSKRKEKIGSVKDGGQSQKLVLGTTRLSSFQMLKGSNQSKMDENRLPGLSQPQVANNSLLQQSYQSHPIGKQYDIHVHKINKIMSINIPLSEYKFNWTKPKVSNKITKVTHKDIFKIKNKLIVNELKKIDKLKTEFMRESNEYKKKEENIFAQTNNSNENKENNIQERRGCSSKQHRLLDKNSKDCQACEYRANKYKVSIQKFSLNQEQIEKIKEKFGKIDYQKTQQSLIMKQDEVGKIKQQDSKREQFLQLKPQEIIKQIAQKGKIPEILKLIEHENIYSFSKASKTHLLR